jgi:zinc transport system substrate-binding protein
MFASGSCHPPRRWIPGWIGSSLLILLFTPLALGATSERLRILTTLVPIHSWAANVAGPDAEVENLLTSDVGPHSFQLRPKDLQKIRTAQVIVANGLGIDNWLDKALRGNASKAQGKVVHLGDGWTNHLIFDLPVLSLDPKSKRRSDRDHNHDHTAGHSHDHNQESPNPHVWLDPSFARYAVTNLAEVFATADPAHADGYRVRAQEYVQRLSVLDRDLQDTISLFPSKAIVTYHDAFPYFARRYGLDLVGVIEEVPSVEPSPRYLKELSQVVRAREVRVIFTEPQFSPRLVRQLSRDLGVQFAELDVLETGQPGTDFYEAGMRRNLAVLKSHLAR